MPLPRRVVRYRSLVRESGARVEAVQPESPAALAGVLAARSAAAR